MDAFVFVGVWLDTLGAAAASGNDEAAHWWEQYRHDTLVNSRIHSCLHMGQICFNVLCAAVLAAFGISCWDSKRVLRIEKG